MPTVGLVFFSGSGTTRVLAESVREGVETAGATCLTLEVVGADISEGRWLNDAMAAQLDDCDALIFGTPTYMGSVAGQLKCFMDAMAGRWYASAWNGKLGAGFTVSSLASGDKQNALFDLTTFAMQMGMLWVGTGVNPGEELNPNGFFLGVGAQASHAGELTDSDRATAVHLGKRVVGVLNSEKRI